MMPTLATDWREVHSCVLSIIELQRDVSFMLTQSHSAFSSFVDAFQRFVSAEHPRIPSSGWIFADEAIFSNFLASRALPELVRAFRKLLSIEFDLLVQKVAFKAFCGFLLSHSKTATG
jgi:hypothetical protein